jgi:hypothetical protein
MEWYTAWRLFCSVEEGFERLRQLAEMAGEARFFAVAERFKIVSVAELPSLAALKQLVEELESLAGERVA